jgi:tetratricopeptide (TPR) repeat protein
MRSKLIFQTLLAALVLAACAVAASAQVTQVEGKVTLKQADGTEVPVAGATIDIYRTDIKGDYHTKTDKKGHYVHAGLPFVGTYTIAVSAPGAQPTYASGLRFTQTQTRDFTLSPGDGSVLTLDKIKSLEAGGVKSSGGSAPPAESKEAKAAREEIEKKNAEIAKKNAEIQKSNETVANTFKAGNEALAAGRVDEAIAAYNEGLATRPDEAALLIKLSEAYRIRGVNRFNAAIKATDADAKTKGFDDAKKDWTDSADAAKKALDAVNAVAATPDNQANVAQNKLAAITVRALAMRFVATKVSPGDPAQAQAAWDAYQALIAAETDPAKKAKDKAEALQMLFDAGATDLAVTQARAVLAEDPDNVDANRILGLALFATGDKTKFQEAANYLQRYVDKAPDTDPLKASAKESLDYLKTAENVKPEKTTPSRPAKRRP